VAEYRLRVVLLWLACGLAFSNAVAELPASRVHRPGLTREAHRVMGLAAPVAALAAQVHQESAWRAEARSHVGAAGLAQFMPATAQWMTEVYPDLGPPEPYAPTWALRAMVLYDQWLLERVVGHTECDRWWAALRSYNGGLGWWRDEARRAVDMRDRGQVDQQCGKGRRSVKHCAENLGYPRQILVRWQPRYASWGRMVMCYVPVG
jgi:soluble lytic murein transglycosylase-like protein